ncbi:MAG TPA: chemotaxis protein CheW [Candidatus Hydrogenedentes bacterium]|nr:chemotaxis protein CheW [Candidatus Hydrogenedentota bacterium]HPG67209.1 chemotaxis protein CheW [Candidatus Hydrogenedentota bacterium]
MADVKETMEHSAAANAAAHAGKYLTFSLGREVYGLAILKVQEIIGMMRVASIPKTPEFVRGVINLRGKVIPILDLRLKFGMGHVDDTARTCIIVVRVAYAGPEMTMGVVVDEVAEVLDIAAEQIEPPPSLGVSFDDAILLGMGKVGEKVVMLLNVDKVLASDEIATMRHMVAEPGQ